MNENAHPIRNSEKSKIKNSQKATLYDRHFFLWSVNVSEISRITKKLCKKIALYVEENMAVVEG